MDIMTYALSIKKSKSYTDSVALYGVPINYPTINPTTLTWQFFNPTIPGYVDTPYTAIGQTPQIGTNNNWWISGFDTGVPINVKGDKGDDGREAEFRVTGMKLEYRLIGDTDWIPLYDFATIEIPAAIFDYITGGKYTANDVFTDQRTGIIYRANRNFTAVSIEDDMAGGDIRQIGGGISDEATINVIDF